MADTAERPLNGQVNSIKDQNGTTHSDDIALATAQHDAIKQVMGKLILAPVDLAAPDLRVLDSGTGDGYWLQDVLSNLPLEATSGIHFVGADLNPAKFPPVASLSNSLQFMTHSIKDPWPSDLQSSFDLVHQRLVVGACGAFPMATAVKQLTELVKPGGWIQLIEPEQVVGLDDGPAMVEFMDLCRDVFVGMGGHIRYAAHLTEWLEQAGMVDVQERGIPLFLGAKIDDERLARRTAYSTGAAMGPLIHYAKSLKKGVSVSDSQIETLEARLRDELLEKGGYYPLRVVWARKPKL